VIDLQAMVGAARAALDNQLVSGGLVLGAVAAAGAAARRLPGRLLHWLESRVVVGVTVNNDDPAYYWLAEWLDHHPYSRRSRNLTATTYTDSDYERVLMFTPAPGNHLLWVGRRPIWLSRRRNEDKATEGPGAGIGGALRTVESFHLRVFGRSQAPARRLLEDARRVHAEHSRQDANIYVNAYNEWVTVGKVAKRPLDSVILPAGVKERVLDDLEQFRAAEDWYYDRGIPYHRGYLFEGVPGSGKSSLVAVLAARFGYNMYLINLGNKSLDDDKLIHLLNRMDDNSVLVFEDVDAASDAREARGKGKAAVKDSGGVSLSGLLNCLDGLLAKDGAVVFMTTNHKDRLDPALVRSGRCDLHVSFGYAEAGQAAEMFRRFFPDRPEAARFGAAVARKQISMAVVQEALITHRHTPEAALAAVEE
jgi:chaperone BCS1